MDHNKKDDRSQAIFTDSVIVYTKISYSKTLNLASSFKSKKHLNFKTLRKSMAQCFSSIEDNRQQGKCDYSQHDALMSAFACMFFQDPSLLHFQKRLEQKYQRNNLKTIFNVTNIPSNNQLRDIIDDTPSEALSPIFKGFYE